MSNYFNKGRALKYRQKRTSDIIFRIHQFEPSGGKHRITREKNDHRRIFAPNTVC
jgi:hypothetical protein